MATKIAIVEDDLAIAQMYRMKFEVDGFEVQTAENGALGLKLIEEFKPDIILLDLMMPEMNGDEVLRHVREADWGKDLKVVILTNLSAQEAPAQLRELDVSQYIVKAEMTPKQVAALVKKELGLATETEATPQPEEPKPEVPKPEQPAPEEPELPKEEHSDIEKPNEQ